MQYFIIIILSIFIFWGNYYLRISHPETSIKSVRETSVQTQTSNEFSTKNSVNQPSVKTVSHEVQNPEKEVKKNTATYKSETDYDFTDKELRTNRAIINEKVGENYADSILSSGRLERWNPASFPLSVYIEHNPNLPPYYYQQIRKAFERWQKVSDNFITFRFVDVMDRADIRCTFPADFEQQCQGNAGRTAYQHYHIVKNLIKYSEIKFSKVSCRRKYYSPDTLYRTALHEIGHSLGMRGHSHNSKDLMYPVVVNNTKQDISDNDIRTLRLIYSIIPDVTNVPFSEQDKKGLITTEEIWGDKDDRIDLQLSDIEKRVKNVSYASDFEYVEMANLYFQKEDYEKSIENFKKALEFTKDKKRVAAIYSNISAGYSKLNNHSEALKYITLANKTEASEERLLRIAYLKYELGDYPEAKLIARNLLNKSSKHYNAYIILYNIYLHEKDYKSAMSIIERGRRAFPKNPPIPYG